MSQFSENELNDLESVIDTELKLFTAENLTKGDCKELLDRLGNDLSEDIAKTKSAALVQAIKRMNLKAIERGIDDFVGRNLFEQTQNLLRKNQDEHFMDVSW